MKISFGRRHATSTKPLALTDDGIRLGSRLRAAFEEPHRTILFTGTRGQDGVSTTATQVALALAQMNEGEVLLVDAALRRPSLHRVFEIEPSPGLAEMLAGKATPESAIHVSEFSGLSVLAAGTSHLDAVTLLTSSAYHHFMEDVRRAFVFTVFDSAPVSHFAETALIAPRMDGVVVVAAAGQRTRSEIREVSHVLEGLHVNVLGIALSQ